MKMEAVSSSASSVNFRRTTRLNIPENSRPCENFKPNTFSYFSVWLLLRFVLPYPATVVMSLTSVVSFPLFCCSAKVRPSLYTTLREFLFFPFPLRHARTGNYLQDLSSDSDGHEEFYLLGYTAVQSVRSEPMFRREHTVSILHDRSTS
jgi:hypothetical protein